MGSPPTILQRGSGKVGAIGQIDRQKDVPKLSLSAPTTGQSSLSEARSPLTSPPKQDMTTEEPTGGEGQMEREGEIEYDSGYPASPTRPQNGSSTTSLDSSNTGSVSGLEISLTQIPTAITTTGFSTQFSDHESDRSCSESEDMEDLEIPSAENTGSSIPLHNPGYEFRLTEVDEDLLKPDQYLEKLQGLQHLICKNSRIGQQYSQPPQSAVSTNATQNSQAWEGLSLEK